MRLFRNVLVPAGLLLALLAVAPSVPGSNKAPKVARAKLAPAFALPATSAGKLLPGRTGSGAVALRDFQGKKNVVLFFFAGVKNPSAAVQCGAFRNLFKEFGKRDAVLLGVSNDRPAVQEEFARHAKLPYPLLSAEGTRVALAYGVLGDDGAIIPTTFVIDKGGFLHSSDRSPNLKTHPEGALKSLRTVGKKRPAGFRPSGRSSRSAPGRSTPSPSPAPPAPKP
jgi:peroxiredoxin Q/BCP